MGSNFSCNRCCGADKEAPKDNHLELVLIIPPEKARTMSNRTNIQEFKTLKSGFGVLELKPTKFYVDKIGLSSSDFVKSRKCYAELGQYGYEGETYTEDFEEKVVTLDDGSKYYYVGQFKTGTKNEDGIGIAVFDDGYIYEGYCKNNMRNGPGRAIYPDGSYYIGEFKNDHENGYGEIYFAAGGSYKGEFEDGRWNGEGRLDLPNGRTLIGEWDDGEYIEDE